MYNTLCYNEPWRYYNNPHLVMWHTDSLGQTGFFGWKQWILWVIFVVGILFLIFFSPEQHDGFVVYHRVTNTATRSRYVASYMTIEWRIKIMWSEGEKDCAILCHSESGCAGFMYINYNRICQIWATEESIVIAWLLTKNGSFSTRSLYGQSCHIKCIWCKVNTCIRSRYLEK